MAAKAKSITFQQYRVTQSFFLLDVTSSTTSVVNYFSAFKSFWHSTLKHIFHQLFSKVFWLIKKNGRAGRVQSRSDRKKQAFSQAAFYLWQKLGYQLLMLPAWFLRQWYPRSASAEWEWKRKDGKRIDMLWAWAWKYWFRPVQGRRGSLFEKFSRRAPSWLQALQVGLLSNPHVLCLQ